MIRNFSNIHAIRIIPIEKFIKIWSKNGEVDEKSHVEFGAVQKNAHLVDLEKC